MALETAQQAKTVAVGCDLLPPRAHGKEGIDGSRGTRGVQLLRNRYSDRESSGAPFSHSAALRETSIPRNRADDPSMVRRGSTVRVRQRALQTPAKAPFVLRLLARAPPCGGYEEPFMESSGHERRRQSRVFALNARSGDVRSPLATINSRSRFSSSRLSPTSISASLPAPKWRSETWRNRAVTIEGRYRLENVVDEPPEIFDDLSRAASGRCAVEATHREPLTTKEQEAIGRWRRLSTWRKAFALGASLSGPSGSASLLGGLIFGRSRKA